MCEEAGSRVPRPLRARPRPGHPREAAECAGRRGPRCPAHSGPGHAPATRRAQRARGEAGAKPWLSDPLGASTGASALPLQRALDTGQCPRPDPGFGASGCLPRTQEVTGRWVLPPVVGLAGWQAVPTQVLVVGLLLALEVKQTVPAPELVHAHGAHGLLVGLAVLHQEVPDADASAGHAGQAGASGAARLPWARQRGRLAAAARTAAHVLVARTATFTSPRLGSVALPLGTESLLARTYPHLVPLPVQERGMAIMKGLDGGPWTQRPLS